MTTSQSDTIDTVKKKMKNIIDFAVTGDTLRNLRQESDNIELSEMFVSYCLIHFTTSYNWRYNTSSVVIPDIFTPSNEALCILLLENTATYYVKIHD